MAFPRSAWSVAFAAAAGLALVVLFWQETGVVRRTSSATYDEPAYARMAFRVREGNFTRLTRAGSAPLPILVEAVALAPFRAADLDTSLQPTIVDRARRAQVVAFGLPLLLVVYFWLMQRRGWVVAAIAAFFVALSPAWLAHASLATTDAALVLWSVVTLAALAHYRHRPDNRRLVLVALTLGLAFASKYSAVCLLPAVVLSLGWTRAGIAVACASIVLWALHGFSVLPMIYPEETLAWLGSGHGAEQVLAAARRVSLPGPLTGALQQLMHQRGGTEAFLFGDTDSAGWWYYYPVALALKSTPAELVVLALTPIVILFTWRRRDHVFTLLAVTLATFSLSLLITHVNIGVRYALPVYLLAVLCVADGLPALPLPKWPLVTVAVVMLAVQTAASVSVAPHYLSYFNGLAGGPSGGQRYLGDSNLDWGQDLPALREELGRLGDPRVCLAYFGTAAVDAYGIRAADWRDANECSAADWFAVSVTYLQGLFIDRDPFAGLRAVTPDRRAAFSIVLYDMRRPTVATVLKNAWAMEARSER